MLSPVFIEFFSAIKNKKIRFLLSSIILFIVAMIALIPIYLTLVSFFSSGGDSPPPSTQALQEKVLTQASQEKVLKTGGIMKVRYPGCSIRSRDGRHTSDNIVLNAPEGFSIINYEEVAKEKNKKISESRSELKNTTFDAKKFTAECIGNGKVKKVLGIVVDHYNAWRYSDIMLTLKKN